MLISLAVVILCKVLKHMQYYICLYCIGFSAHGFSCYSSSFKVGWKWKCAIYREARQKDVRPKKTLYPEMWAMRKICTGKATNLFFNQFCRDILFAFFVFLFLFVCFLESKICILIHTFFCPKVSWHCHQRGPSLAEHSLSILPLTLNLQFDSFGKSMCHQLIWGGQKYISGNILNISKRYQRIETKKKWCWVMEM